MNQIERPDFENEATPLLYAEIQGWGYPVQISGIPFTKVVRAEGQSRRCFVVIHGPRCFTENIQAISIPKTRDIVFVGEPGKENVTDFSTPTDSSVEIHLYIEEPKL